MFLSVMYRHFMILSICAAYNACLCPTRFEKYYIYNNNNTNMFIL